MTRKRASVIAWGAAAVALVWGCAESVSPGPLTERTLFNAIPGDGAVDVCKFGPAGTSANFTVSASQGTFPYGTSFTLQAVPFEGGSCTDGFNRLVVWLPAGSTGNTVVTVTEVSSTPGTFVERITVFSENGDFDLWYPETSATVTVSADARAGMFFKNNGTPREGGEGCTPGYWKQSHHFDSWPAAYTPGQSVGSVFAQASLYSVKGQLASAYTLVQGLSFQGGSTPAGAAQILLRAGIAAVLNSATDLDYPTATADIIADVNAALASGDRETMLLLAGQLDADNNLGCTLN